MNDVCWAKFIKKNHEDSKEKKKNRQKKLGVRNRNERKKRL